MMSQFRNKKQIEYKKKNIKTILILVFFVILISLGFMSLTGRIFNFIGRPIWEAKKTISDEIYDINYVFRSKSSITKENHNLIEEISWLRLKMADYEILEKENLELKEIMGRIYTKDDFVIANILTKPNHSPYDTVIIDIGSNFGVEVNNRVYVNGDTPVGLIDKVYNNTSLVVLYSNPGQKTEGFIDGSNASVVLSGRGGGNFEMIIPAELSVEHGSIIYLPGSKSLVLAIVDEVISKASEPFKKVLLSSPVNIQNIKWVQVDTN